MEEEIKIYTDKMNESIKDKLKDDREELEFYCRLVECFNKVSESLFKLKDRDLIREIEVSKLQDENKKQKEVIDKAKNHINNKFLAQGGVTSYEWNDLLSELLDILNECQNEQKNLVDLGFYKDEPINFKFDTSINKPVLCKRCDNYYYAYPSKKGWVYYRSRNLGERDKEIIDIPFDEWTYEVLKEVSE